MNAVEVHNLRKEFVRKDGRKRTRVAALRGITFEIGARRVHRHPGPERLGEVDAGPAALDAAAAGRRQRAHLRPRHLRDAGRPHARQPRVGRGVVLQEDVGDREPRLRGAVLRADAEGDAGSGSRRSSTGSASRPRGARTRWRTCRAGRSRRSRSRGRCSPRRCCSCSTSRPRASTRARSSRCRTSSARCGRSTTRRSCSARTTSPRRRSSPSGSGSSTTVELLCLEPADEIKERYGVETLEEAFFAATGRTFEDEREEEEEEVKA